LKSTKLILIILII